MTQPPRLLPGTALQLLVTEVLLGALLSGEHIALRQRKAVITGEGEEGLQIERLGGVVKPGLQIRMPAGMGEEGVELLEAHRRAAVAPV